MSQCAPLFICRQRQIINYLASIIKQTYSITPHLPCHDAHDLAGAMIELPPSDTKRWVVRRKAAVVQAVRVGMISLQEACLRYDLSVEEFFAWQRAVERHGIPGLRVTRLQIYRDPEAPCSAK